MESTKPKNGVGKEAAKPEFRSFMPSLKPFTANTLRCEQPASPRLGCFYHIAAPRLSFTTSPNPGTIFSGNQNRPFRGIRKPVTERAGRNLAVPHFQPVAGSHGLSSVWINRGFFERKAHGWNSANRGYPALAEFTLSESPRFLAQNDGHDSDSLSN